jgi:hypothetical protein
MGQSKLRGSYQERILLAKAKVDALRPDKLVCNNCKTEFTEFYAMDSRNLLGIDAIFAGVCPGCQRATYAYRGDPDSVAELVLAQQEVMGGGDFGMQKIKS